MKGYSSVQTPDVDRRVSMRRPCVARDNWSVFEDGQDTYVFLVEIRQAPTCSSPRLKGTIPNVLV